MHRRSRRTSLTLLVVAGWAALACGGLPVAMPPGADPTAAGPAPDPLPAPQPEEELPTNGPPPAGPDPYAQFAPLDASEAPPKAADPKCDAGNSVIRYPRGPAMEVYCATTAGMKHGAWQRVQGRDVTEVRTYDQGQQVGRAVRWTKGIKVAEENWVAGQQEGDVAEWNDAGILMVRGTMQAGKRHGKFLLRSPARPEDFDGRCYLAGAESWATTDPAEFVSKPCP